MLVKFEMILLNFVQLWILLHKKNLGNDIL